MSGKTDKPSAEHSHTHHSIGSDIDYRELVEAQSDMVVKVDVEGRFLYVSPSYCRTFGKTARELLGSSFMPQVHEDDREPTAQAMETLWQPPHTAYMEQRCMTVDGWRWLSWQDTALLGPDGQVTAIIGVGRDITLQRQMESSQRESEEKFAAAFNLSPALMSISTIDEGRYLDVNDCFCQISGFDRRDVIGRTSIELGWIPAAKREEMKAILQRDGQISDVELELKRKDGAVFTVLYSAAFITIAGQKRLLSIALDISERKKNQDKLDYLSECFNQALHGSRHILYRLNVKKGCYDYLSPAAEKIHGIPYADSLGFSLEQVFEFIHPDDRSRISTIIDSAIRTRTSNSIDLELEYRIRKTDGSYTWLLDSTRLVVDDDGKMQYFFGSAYDINTLKESSQSLRESEKRYQAIVNTQTEFVDRYLPGGILTFVNEALCRYWGIRPADLIGKSFYPFLQEDDLQVLLAKLAALTPENPCVDVENRVNFHDGTIHWHSWTHHAIFDQDGTVIEYQSVGRNITAQRLAEEAKRNSEQMAQAILSSTNDLILFISTDGTILLANEAVAERFGQMIDSFVGTNIFPYFPEEVRRLRQGKLAKSVQTRSPVRYEDDRAGRHFDNCLYPVIGADRTVTGVAIFSRDISERKEYETALKKAKDELETRVDERTASLAKATEQIRQMTFQLLKAEEQERMRIAAELHDQVGQSLLLAKMKVDALASDTTTDKNDNNSADISRLLEDCIQDIRSLTFAMRPPLLDTAGFESALQWLCKSMDEDYRVKFDFSTSCQSIQLNSEQRYSLYQSVRELLLNVVKHAGVTHAELSLKTAGSDLIIQVSDKGSGFDTKAEPCTSATGFGFGLFNVSQRLNLLGGSCDLESEPGKGTIATLTIPMGE